MRWYEEFDEYYTCTNCNTAITVNVLDGILAMVPGARCPGCGEQFEGDQEQFRDEHGLREHRSVTSDGIVDRIFG